MSGALLGRSAIVTGASQGLGKAIAEAYVGAGANVCICARDAALLETVRRELSEIAASGQRVAAVTADVSQPEEVKALVESAEMTKHAINAFLATSVAFANELAILCEATGADAKDVERGLKSESRIGPKAYLSPGAAFAGGTLARDLMFLTELGRRSNRPTPLLSAAGESNELHRQWAERRLQDELGDLQGRRIAVWGLTYKPGTDTLRRSSAVQLCRRLTARGASIRAHDPVVRALPEDLARDIELAPSAVEALADASALVVATEWPEYRLVDPSEVVGAMRQPCVLDAGRFLAGSLGRDSRVRYVTVGRGTA